MTEEKKEGDLSIKGLSEMPLHELAKHFMASQVFVFLFFLVDCLMAGFNLGRIPQSLEEVATHAHGIVGFPGTALIEITFLGVFLIAIGRRVFIGAFSRSKS